MNCHLRSPAIVLLVVMLSIESQPFGMQRTSSYSIPISPTVVTTIIGRDQRLLLLVLWRGPVRWYSTGNHRRASAGAGQDGTVHATLQYGDVDADLVFNP